MSDLFGTQIVGFLTHRLLYLFRSKRRREDPEFGKKKFGGKRSNQGKRGNLKKNAKQGFHGGKKSRGGGGGKRGGKR